MTVDLRKLRVGDTVKFRCGGEVLVMGVACGVSGLFGVALGKYSCDTTYCVNGVVSGVSNVFDIVEIIPKPFDWDDAALEGVK